MQIRYSIKWMKQNYLVILFFYLFYFADPLMAYIDFPYAVSFQTIRVPLMPLDYEPAENGKAIVRMNFRWINVWSIQDSQFIIDGEELQLEPSLRYSFSERIQGGLAWSFKVQGGGILDSWIEGFHNAVNVTQGGRERFRRNSINVSYETVGDFYPWIDNDPLKTLLRKNLDRNYPRLYTSPPVSNSKLPFNLPSEIIPISGKDRQGLDNPVVYMEYRTGSHVEGIDELIFGTSYRLSVVRSEDLFASPGNDISVYSVIKSRDRSRGLILSLGLSYTLYQKRHFYLLDLPDSQIVIRPALEYQLDEWNAIIEYVYFSNPVEHFGELSRTGHQISMALKKDYSDYKVTFGVVENFMNYGITPDVGFLATVDFMQFPI